MIPHYALAQILFENRTHLDLTVAVQERDGKLVLIVNEREAQTAAGLIIPKRGDKQLVN